jgi:hypothetical protein
MKKLLTGQKRNYGITRIELSPESSKEFFNNVFTALRKFSSSRKTKAVHKITGKQAIMPALFHGEAAKYLVAPFFKETVFNFLTFNLYYFDDSLDQRGAVLYATELLKLDEKIQKEKTFVNEKQIFNLEHLQEKKTEVEQKLLNSMDYIKLIDGIYFGWLMFLSALVVMQEGGSKPKIITTAADILADILKKVYLKANTKIEPEAHQLLEAIAIYFIRIYFYGETAQYALNMMKKGFPEEVLESIKISKVTRFKEFNDLSLILKETQLLAITPSTFDLQMQKMFGKYAYETYIQDNLTSFIAFMANLAHPTQIFKDSYEVNKDSHLRLEELILNEQKRVTFYLDRSK